MDKCFRILFAVTISFQVTYGITYKGLKHDAHESFHHGFEHLDPSYWHNGHPEWHSPEEYRHPRTFPPQAEEWKKDRFHNHDLGDKTYWRLHHPAHIDWPSYNQERHWANGQPGSWPDHGNYWNNNGWNDPNGWNGQDPSHSWPNHGRPNDWGPLKPTRRPTTTTIAPTSSGPRQGVTPSPLEIALCIRNCPVTSEYNPVCGSNNVTYGNPGRLECAKNCGIDVSLKRNSACPRPGTTEMTSTTQTPSRTTSAATIKDIPPTRFTTIDIPSSERPSSAGPNSETDFTIPPEILSSIFTTPPPDDNYDIDIRTRSKFITQYVHPVRI